MLKRKHLNVTIDKISQKCLNKNQREKRLNEKLLMFTIKQLNKNKHIFTLLHFFIFKFSINQTDFLTETFKLLSNKIMINKF